MRKKKIIEKLKESFGQFKDDDFRFDLIEKYFVNKDNCDSFQVLSEKTCNDLNFEEFMFLDRTTSKVGQQCFYNKLRVIPNSITDKDKKEKLIKKLTDDKDFRINTQLKLEKLNKADVFYISSLFQEEHQEPPKWFYIIRLLSFISFVSLVMLSFNPQMFFVFLCTFLVNIGIHYWNKRHLNKYLGSIPQLLKLNNIANNLFKEQSFQHFQKIIILYLFQLMILN